MRSFNEQFVKLAKHANYAKLTKVAICLFSNEARMTKLFFHFYISVFAVHYRSFASIYDIGGIKFDAKPPNLILRYSSLINENTTGESVKKGKKVVWPNSSMYQTITLLLEIFPFWFENVCELRQERLKLHNTVSLGHLFSFCVRIPGEVRLARPHQDY